MIKKLHFNKPQLKSMLIGAPVEVLVAGRGTGKSEGVLAPKSAKCYFGTMPRGTGVVIGATYNQLLTRTLPALVAGWERIGYHMNVHYLIGKKPTDKWLKLWKWKGPYRPPMSFQYFISWWNGAGAHLVSQDRQGSANGITIDWIIGDELKLLNEEKLKTELLPANRGIIPEFVNNPYHHGQTYTTDMPVGTAGRWILGMADKMDREKINEVWRLQVIRYKLMHQLKTEKAEYIKKEIKKQVDVIDAELNDLRRDLLFYHEASTLENIHALGVEYIKQQMRDTTSFQFDTQILNLRPMKVEDGFYPDFNEEVHGYFASDNSYLESFEFDFSKLQTIDCRRDSDLNVNDALHISLDYNRRIHPLVVAQVNDKQLRILKGIHSLYPDKLKEAIDQFIVYYKSHKKKMVYYWYDHTAVGDQHQTRICDDVIKALRVADWVVIPKYIGKAPEHKDKYRMWGALLKETGKYKRKFVINRENCDKLILSLNQAAAEIKKDGFSKNKKPEQDPKFPAEEATHYSDALDTLVFGILESGLQFNQTTSTEGSRIVMI